MTICDIIIGIIGTVELSSKTGTGLIVVSVAWVVAYAMSVAPIGKSVVPIDSCLHGSFLAATA